MRVYVVYDQEKIDCLYHDVVDQIFLTWQRAIDYVLKKEADNIKLYVENGTRSAQDIASGYVFEYEVN